MRSQSLAHLHSFFPSFVLSELRGRCGPGQTQPGTKPFEKKGDIHMMAEHSDEEAMKAVRGIFEQCVFISPSLPHLISPPPPSPHLPPSPLYPHIPLTNKPPKIQQNLQLHFLHRLRHPLNVHAQTALRNQQGDYNIRITDRRAICESQRRDAWWCRGRHF